MYIPIYSKLPIPERLPRELEEFLGTLSDIADRRVLVEKLFDFVTSRWGGPRYGLILHLSRLFSHGLETFIRTQGYLHCTNMNYIMRVLLIHSGKFEESDIELRLTHTWYIGIHEYMSIRISEIQYISCDPWNYQFGIPFGKYGKGFDSMRIFPIKEIGSLPSRHHD